MSPQRPFCLSAPCSQTQLSPGFTVRRNLPRTKPKQLYLVQDRRNSKKPSSANLQSLNIYQTFTSCVALIQTCMARKTPPITQRRSTYIQKSSEIQVTDLHHVSNSFFTLKFRSLSPPGDVLPVRAANKMQSKTAHPNNPLFILLSQSISFILRQYDSQAFSRKKSA